MDMPAIVAKVNTEISGCQIIPAGKGWGKARWLVQESGSGLCKPISQSAIVAIAMERYLLPGSAAARALGRLGGSAGTEAQKAAARKNGRRPVKPGSRPRGRPRKVTGK